MSLSSLKIKIASIALLLVELVAVASPVHADDVHFKTLVFVIDRNIDVDERIAAERIAASIESLLGFREIAVVPPASNRGNKVTCSERVDAVLSVNVGFLNSLGPKSSAATVLTSLTFCGSGRSVSSQFSEDFSGDASPRLDGRLERALRAIESKTIDEIVKASGKL